MNRTIALAIFLVSFVFVSALRAYCALTDTDSSGETTTKIEDFSPWIFWSNFLSYIFRTEIKYEYDMRGPYFCLSLRYSVTSSYKSARLIHFAGHSFYDGFLLLILFMTKLSFEVKHHNWFTNKKPYTIRIILALVYRQTLFHKNEISDHYRFVWCVLVPILGTRDTIA